jgi:hypothetical protein
MARIHPNFPLHQPASLGEYRERDVLDILAKGLPDSFDVFHNLNWSTVSSHGLTVWENDEFPAKLREPFPDLNYPHH